MKAIQNLNPNSNRISLLQNQLIQLEKEAKEKILQCKQMEEKRAIYAIKSNPNYFYSYAKHNRSAKSRIGPLRDQQLGTEVYVDDPKMMADILQNQFISVFSDPKHTQIGIEPNETFTENTIDDINFTKEDLSRAIDEIKENSAAADEGFPALVLKKCKTNLTYPLLLLWSTSIKTGFIHDMFLHQLITPIYKGKGSKCKAVNYRPISLTSHVIKVFERVIRNKLVRHLEENQILSPNQHRFRKGRTFNNNRFKLIMPLF